MLDNGEATDPERFNNHTFYMGNWKWHPHADAVLLQNQILLLIVMTIPGQLVTQLLAAGKMLDFLDMRFYAYYTVAIPSMATEFIGITHTAYVLKDLDTMISGKQEDPAKKMQKNWFHVVRCIYSVALVLFAVVVVSYGSIQGQTNCWDTLPAGGALALSWFFLFFIGCCEGFQIAAMTLAKMPKEELRKTYPLAYKVGAPTHAHLVSRLCEHLHARERAHTLDPENVHCTLCTSDCHADTCACAAFGDATADARSSNGSSLPTT